MTAPTVGAIAGANAILVSKASAPGEASGRTLELEPRRDVDPVPTGSATIVAARPVAAAAVIAHMAITPAFGSMLILV